MKYAILCRCSKGYKTKDETGKLFFPDRKFKDACEGVCKVNSVSDRGRYGFFTGEMVKLEDVTAKEFAESLAEKSDEYLESIEYVRKYGELVVVERTGYVDIFCKINGEIVCVLEESLDDRKGFKIYDEIVWNRGYPNSNEYQSNRTFDSKMKFYLAMANASLITGNFIMDAAVRFAIRSKHRLATNSVEFAVYNNRLVKFQLGPDCAIMYRDASGEIKMIDLFYDNLAGDVTCGGVITAKEIYKFVSENKISDEVRKTDRVVKRTCQAFGQRFSVNCFSGSSWDSEVITEQERLDVTNSWKEFEKEVKAIAKHSTQRDVDELRKLFVLNVLGFSD